MTFVNQGGGLTVPAQDRVSLEATTRYCLGGQRGVPSTREAITGLEARALSGADLKSATASRDLLFVNAGRLQHSRCRVMGGANGFEIA